MTVDDGCPIVIIRWLQSHDKRLQMGFVIQWLDNNRQEQTYDYYEVIMIMRWWLDNND